jgi:hypothetical protein
MEVGLELVHGDPMPILQRELMWLRFFSSRQHGLQARKRLGMRLTVMHQ